MTIERDDVGSQFALRIRFKSSKSGDISSGSFTCIFDIIKIR